MRLFIHTLPDPEVILADDHAAFRPAVGSIVWISYRPWVVLSCTALPCDDGVTHLNVVVEPAPG